jgi:hypothetical protein
LRVTRLLQSIVLLLNLTPLRSILSRIYDLGVRNVVAALSGHPAVACILGSGSYFEKRATFGLSDVDLIIVLNDKVTRADPAARELAHTYERSRRLFPFLGRWPEKEANLIFLSDIAAGFPAPESFRVRWKQDRLIPLYGRVPEEMVGAKFGTSDLLAEINTLLRFSLVSDPRQVRRMVFWKRIFTKLIALADQLNLPQSVKEIRERPELTFLSEEDTPLFFRKCDAVRLFSLQLKLTRQLFDKLASREASIKIQPVPFVEHAPHDETTPAFTPTPFSHDLQSGNQRLFSLKTVPSVPIGLGPRQLYFSIDEPIPLLDLEAEPYTALQYLRHAVRLQAGPVDENALVSVEGFLFLITRQPRFVDLIPLDPLQFANVYGAAFNDTGAFEMPAKILAEQTATADTMFHALGHMYRINDGMVTKLPHPCIYREHDAEVVESALRMLRARAARAPEWISIRHTGDLFIYLRRRYPGCQEFLTELERYQRSLYGDSSLGEPKANNIYHCLHQFMAQVLTDTPTIKVNSPEMHLGITVGVITRNRAGDLTEMLESLTRQKRLPDEVLVVDNGSTDETQAVLERFHERLPLRCKFLERADIPAARNLVIESASNEIISFIDDDCISEPQWLAAVERGFLRADNIGIVGGWVRHEAAPRRSTVDNYYRVFHHTKS